ncbi:MAG: A24 family peptidase [Candidatus Woesearchaeota archaeon]
MIDIFIMIIIITALLIASYNDIRTREVPDWLNFSLIGAGLGIRLIFSIVQNDFSYLLYGAIGFGAFVAIAYLMFYTGQWGGGDSKLLMGLGALIGINIPIIDIPFLLSFIINIFVIGAIYGLIFSLVMAIVNLKAFLKELRKIIVKKMVKRARWIFLSLGLALIILSLFLPDLFLKFLGIALGCLIILTFYLWVFIKAIEKSCMIKLVTPDRLTEGDWIVKDIKYKGKRITGPKDLGVEKKQIEELKNLYRQKKIGKVLIKEGIPFVPSFLVAYILTLIFGNLLFLLLI